MESGSNKSVLKKNKLNSDCGSLGGFERGNCTLKGADTHRLKLAL